MIKCKKASSRYIFLQKWRVARIFLLMLTANKNKKMKETSSSPYTYRVCYYAYFIPFPSFSFRIRFRKSLTMRGNPSLRGIFGSQFSSSLALLISGFLMCGSSAVFGLYSIVALESIVSLTTCVFMKRWQW